ncbi:hypothetical protein Tfer_3109 [Thermincola ferriacetica]|uniref:Uncharacterized protein n=1 Tax=Thermincola ferriacetica TaxID=281456 RepID=A0A0L6VYM8_9FIRM|nr:hypothetical protein [Thermincola ferriacetica]KNZ68370.1 hypothetical protein Tfer_3109 [Thermincola ferriacetica]
MMKRIKVLSEKVLGYLLVTILWMAETMVFILSPLILHMMIAGLFEVPSEKIFQLTDISVISLILFGDTTKTLIIFYRKKKGFELKLRRTMTIGIAGIVVSSVLLTFGLIKTYNPSFKVGPSIYEIQIIWFVLAILWSALSNIPIAMKNGLDKHFLSLEDEL